jgi:hypothetical protein
VGRDDEHEQQKNMNANDVKINLLISQMAPKHSYYGLALAG